MVRPDVEDRSNTEMPMESMAFVIACPSALTEYPPLLLFTEGMMPSTNLVKVTGSRLDS